MYGFIVEYLKLPETLATLSEEYLACGTIIFSIICTLWFIDLFVDIFRNFWK